jgi:ion channel POLLUX/CASTOR
VFNEVPEEIKLTGSGLDIGGLLNIKLVHKEGNAIIRQHLESLPMETFDSVSTNCSF